MGDDYPNDLPPEWKAAAEAIARTPVRQLREDGVWDPYLGAYFESDEQFRQRLMAEMRERDEKK